MGKKEGFTIVELVVVMAVMAVMITLLYQIFFRGFLQHEASMKNLNAVQQMAFIIFNLKNDMRTLIEFESEPDTLLRFYPDEKRLKFNVVNGVSEDGTKIYSEVNYYFDDKNCFTRAFYEINGNEMGGLKNKRLAGAAKIKDFKIEIYDSEGRAVDIPRKGKGPAILKTSITHADNSRLSVNISIYSTYIESEYGTGDDKIEAFRTPGWKLKSVSPTFAAVTNLDKNKVFFDIEKMSGVNISFNGIKVGTTMDIQPTAKFKNIVPPNADELPPAIPGMPMINPLTGEPL